MPASILWKPWSDSGSNGTPRGAARFLKGLRCRQHDPHDVRVIIKLFLWLFHRKLCGDRVHLELIRQGNQQEGNQPEGPQH